MKHTLRQRKRPSFDGLFCCKKRKCPIEKFTNYVFVPSLIDDKKQLFELWGYDIMDSQYLQQEFIKQAQLAYSNGRIVLTTPYGGRI